MKRGLRKERQEIGKRKKRKRGEIIPISMDNK
jgi:hypothetical protein